MALQPISQAPQPHIALNNKDAPHVGFGYMDDYQQMQMAQYNNEFNYWVWQQQAEYNSPKAQMERAKEAGLNPNVVAGNVSSGNLSNAPQSNARASGNVTGNQLQMANLAINSFNSLIKAVGEGVDATSKISGIPADIPNYRFYLGEQLKNSVEGKKLDNWLKSVEKARIAYQAGVSQEDLGHMGLPEEFIEYLGMSPDKKKQYFRFKNSALTKMWDAMASTPEISNNLKKSAIPKNNVQTSLYQSVKKLNDKKAEITQKDIDNYELLMWLNQFHRFANDIGGFVSPVKLPGLH